jgi:hypothetical protein
MLLLNYLLKAGEAGQAKQIVPLIQQHLSPTTGAKVMTITEELIEHGVQQGEATLLTRQLQRKFGTLPSEYRQQVEKADTARLLEWGEQVLVADSLEALFANK